MKKQLFFALSLSTAFLMTACKSQESAYRQAYEKAKAQELAQNRAAGENGEASKTTVAVSPVDESVEVTPVTTTPVSTTADHSDVRTIDGGFKLVSGSSLKTYSVVVGSFVTQANAEGLMSTLRERGYDARVVKTNETINGQTGWFRVIASSFEDKSSAAQSRDELKNTYAGAWLLYNK